MVDAVLTASAISNVSSRSAALLPLNVRKLRLTADKRVLIDNLDLQISGNGITVVLGPNGAGKSLLVRLLHGLIEPDSGDITWNGEPVGEPVRARQAMVFQHPVLLRRSVAANIDFVLKLRGKSGPSARDRVLDGAGLLPLARQPARLLSGGEQQRLALARALATEPQVLFLDEPTASLDPASVLEIEGLILGARKTGAKIIMVTHDLGQARRLADEVVFIHRGTVMEHASASMFFNGPSTREAQSYLDGRIVL